MLIRIFNHLLKLTKRIIIFFFSFVVLYFIAAWVCSNIPTSPKKTNGVAFHEIYVASNGVHTDVILPIEVLNNRFKQLLEYKTQPNYVAFGWGDKGFYLNTPTWGDLTFSTAVNAVFLESPTAMHVTEHKSIGPDWKKVSINNFQLKSIQNAILANFKLKEHSFIKIEGYTYGNTDTFYEAMGSYSCLKTCNTWTNQILKKGDIKTAIWTPFDSGILKHL